MRLRMLGFLAAALLLAPTASTADEPRKPLATKVFSVADLVTPIPDFGPDAGPVDAQRQQATVEEGAQKLMKQVTAMVRPYSWEGMGGPGKLEFFNIGSALVVNNSPEVIAEVSDLLEGLRRLQDTAIATEVRILTVPAGLCERIGVKKDAGTGLSAGDVRKLFEFAQQHPTTTVMQAPKLTTFDGQTATIRIGERRMFVTRMETMVVNGSPVFVPKETAFDLGDTLTIRGRISVDRRFVSLDAKLTRNTLAEPVALVPVSTLITPVFEGGSQGQPVPFTQYLQVPDLKTRTVEKLVVVPDGGTVVLGGWTEAADPRFGPPALSKIPYLNRLYKNVGPAATREVIVLATTHIITSAPESAPAPHEGRTCAVAPASLEVRTTGDVVTAVHQLRNVGALDAAAAVTAHLERKKLRAIVIGEPRSNQVLVTAAPALAKDIERILTALDVAPPQLVVQATIMQVTPGFLGDAGLTDDETSKNVLTLTARELNVFQAAIRRGKAAGELEVLSHPQVQVADNQAGMVQVGGKMPIVTGLEITSAENGLTVSQKIEQVDHGVTLRLTPRILPEGDVLLRAEPVVSSVLEESVTKPLTLPPEVTGRSEAVTIPVVSRGVSQIQTLSTTARVKDGQTIILRGLHSPYAKRGEGELLIVLTPHVMKSERDAGR